MRGKKVRPGDGHELRRYRWWQPFTRTLFHIRLPDADGRPRLWSVDVRLMGDGDDGEVRARLYLDGANQAVSKLPAVFPVPGGRIEVAASSFGLKRCHFVPLDADGREAGSARQLAPDPASAEGRRARLDRRRPGLSRAMGAASIVVLVVALALGLPQLVETVTSLPFLAEHIDPIRSPLVLPPWANVALVVGGIVASTERALRLRYNWLLDGGGEVPLGDA
ncbi:hypothetical protein [Homoserinibacter sp. YIM 151385]|uniref:hypothetical protein n=1 Tax=Homoserinibacter sp. YIM 151385 TaxID=2985506 RepID=UPI0022F0201A|nr:hypothetical protein [Homoserinibacter sp. YIM 151385]WBU37915.1 hypothetical protein OF852_13515 [Homoserinibacter sp. YIM 151385]